MPEARQAALPLARPTGAPVFAARSVLVRTKIPGMDVAINPYVGCTYGCGYCYASFMGRSVGRDREEWGGYVYAKSNLRTVLRRELRRPRNGRATQERDAALVATFQRFQAEPHLISAHVDRWSG
jgi:hypothetical protein